mgnify:FL=1
MYTKRETHQVFGDDRSFVPATVFYARMFQNLKEGIARESWKTIPAVENDEICLVDDELVSHPGPCMIDGREEVLYAGYPARRIMSSCF